MRLVAKLVLVPVFCAGAAGAEEFVVTMSDGLYAPASINASVGDTIRFVNDDGTEHNVFSPTARRAFDLGALEPGAQVGLALRAPGGFDVECVFHAHMNLRVEVGS